MIRACSRTVSFLIYSLAIAGAFILSGCGSSGGSSGNLPSGGGAGPIWSLSKTTTYSNGLAVDSSGSVYVAGQTTGNLACNGASSCASSAQGDADYFVTKYTSGGTWLWTRQLVETGTGAGVNAMAIDASSNIYVFGSTGGNLVSCNGVS